MVRVSTAGVCLGLLTAASGAPADVTYTFQARSITAETTVNNNVQSLAATTFGPFVEQLNLEAPMITPGGATATNASRVGIDCQLDPNAIRVTGSLSGAGGVSIVGGQPTLQFGEAEARVETVFLVSTATPFRLTASARPSTRPGDRYELKLKNETTGQILFQLDETMPPQTVDFSGVLNPAEYEFEFQGELTVDGPEVLRNFFVNLRLGACYANCDGSTEAPELTANDFLCFINRYASGSSEANCDGSTGSPVLTANDFICFIGQYAAGCS